jgi:hypothetical protein
MASLYVNVPPTVHRFYLIVLNAIMAVMIVSTLPPWLIFLFVFIAAAGDVISIMRPRLRLLSPFLLPANIELLYQTPRILYTLGNGTAKQFNLRAAELMWYGLLMGMVHLVIENVVPAYIILLGAISIVVFVCPYTGNKLRPLPVAFLGLALLFALNGTTLQPFLNSVDFLHGPTARTSGLLVLG